MSRPYVANGTSSRHGTNKANDEMTWHDIANQIRGSEALARRPACGRRAFTLIELLVVMAITAILLGLIFGPLVQGFNLTNRARVQVLTQDTARRVMEIVSRDVSNGVFIFDNTPLFAPNSSQDLRSINIYVHKPGPSGFPDPTQPVIAQSLAYGMIDLVPPARAHDQDTTIQPKDVDPTTGLAIDRGDIALPIRPGRVIIRYFLGLRNNTSTTVNGAGQPTKPYANFYDSPQNINLTDHNPVILYRAVVSPYLPDGRVDRRFFNVDASGTPVLYDPNFFYDTTNPPAGLPAIPGFSSGNAASNARGYGAIWENWKAISRALVPTDRGDELAMERDDATNKPIFDQNNGTGYVLDPLVRFQPTYVGNDAGTPTSVTDYANEAPNVPPSANVESYGHWTTPYRLYIYRDRLDRQPDLPLFFWLNNGYIDDQVMDQLYNQSSQTVTQNNAAHFFPNWRPILLDPQTGGQIAPAGSTAGSQSTPPEIMFTADARRGVINFTFPDSVMLHDGQGKPTPSLWAPDDATNGFPAINQRFYNVQPGNLNGVEAAEPIRYVSLLTPPNNNGKSPLNTLSPSSLVPGGEVVTGPDMTPGPNYGRAVVYTRLPAQTPIGDIGYNQYIIRYADVPNAQPSTAADPTVAAMENALQKAGTLVFDSHATLTDASGGAGQGPVADSGGNPHGFPLVDANGNPAAPLTVTYQFQMNQGQYSVKADYLTRHLMTFSLGVKLYDFNSGQPQQVTLTQKIKVRNLQR